MSYYKVAFNTMPRVLRAITRKGSGTQTASYTFNGTKPEIEISCLRNTNWTKKYTDGHSEFVPSGQTNIRMPFDSFTYFAEGLPNLEYSTMIFTNYSDITVIDAEEVIRLYQGGLPPKTVLPMIFILPEKLPVILPKAESVLLKMCELFYNGGFSSHLKMISCLLQFLAEFTEYCATQAFRDVNHSSSYSTTLYSSRVMKFVSEHMQQKITLSDLADHIGVSCEYLSRVFKAETGKTIVSYINAMKIEYIKGLISERGMSLRDAGYMAGFENEYYLNRLFKSHTGLTSSEYKKLHTDR